jgi:hypothetical protein
VACTRPTSLSWILTMLSATRAAPYHACDVSAIISTASSEAATEADDACERSLD